MKWEASRSQMQPSVTRPSRGRVGVPAEDAFRNWICGSPAKLWIGYWRWGIASSWISSRGQAACESLGNRCLFLVLGQESSGCSLRLSCKRRAGTARDLTSRLQIDRKPNSELPS